MVLVDLIYSFSDEDLESGGEGGVCGCDVDVLEFVIMVDYLIIEDIDDIGVVFFLRI